MNELTALLTEVADEAKVYGSTEQAIHLVRRRRRLTRIVPLVAAAAVVLTLVAVSVPLLRGDVDQQVTGSVSWLPQRLTLAKNPAPLPTNRGVGRASLVYATPSLSHVLVTPNGSQYQLPTSAQQYTLSPDGRWLLALDSGRTWLRDLTGTTVRAFDRGEFGDSRATWAPDSSLLTYTPVVCAIEPTSTTCPYGSDTTVVELNSDRQHTVDLSTYPGAKVCGVRTSGDLVLCTGFSDAPPQVWVVDGRTGAERSHVTVDLTNNLTAAERQSVQTDGPFHDWQGMLADRSALILRTSEYLAAQKTAVPADLIMVDIATGRVTGRVDLPRQTVGTPSTDPSSGSVSYTATDERHLIADLPEGLLLRHFAPVSDAESFLRALELIDPTTGRLGVTTLFDGKVFDLTVRGAGW